MTWTYSGDPASSDRDKVRFLVFDTDATEQLISDEEVLWLISEQSNVYMAAANAAEAIAAKFAKDLNRSAVGLSASPGNRGAFYLELADKLRAQISTTNRHGDIFVGGLSLDKKADLDADPDNVQPAFKVGMFDKAGA
jgi:hypothetical protein